MNRRAFLIGLGCFALTPFLAHGQTKKHPFNATWDKMQETYLKEDELVFEYGNDFNNNHPTRYKTSAKRIQICDELIENNKTQTKCYEKLRKLEMGE